MEYFKEKKQNNRGFSLVELIVVVLIIGILAVVIAPRVMAHVSAARENVCKNNVVEIENCYDREQAAQSGATLEEVVKDKDKAYFGGRMKCPADGTYMAVMAEDGTKRKIVVCTQHSDGIHKVNAQTYHTMEKLLAMTPAERREFLGIDNNNISNDTIRRKILEMLGGEYESVSEDIQTKISTTEKMYVKPMITWGSTSGSGIEKNEYVLYANNKVDDSGAGLWNANAVFDPNSGIWYKYVNSESDTYSLASKTYEKVISDIKNNPSEWKALN